MTDIEIEQILRQGITAHKEGRLEEAEKRYRSILDIKPHHPDANHNLGVLAVNVGKVNDSLHYFKIALEANVNIEQFWLSYINALIKLGQLDTARRVLRQGQDAGLKSDKVDTLEAQLNGIAGSIASSDTHPSKEQLERLISLYHKGKLQEALTQGENLSNQFPYNPNIPNVLGAVHFGLGDPQAAILSYKKSLNLKPDLVEVYNSLGNTFNSFKRYKDAESCYVKAITLRPNYIEAYNNFGVLLNTISDNSLAAQNLKKAIFVDGLNYRSL